MPKGKITGTVRENQTPPGKKSVQSRKLPHYPGLDLATTTTKKVWNKSLVEKRIPDRYFHAELHKDKKSRTWLECDAEVEKSIPYTNKTKMGSLLR